MKTAPWWGGDAVLHIGQSCRDVIPYIAVLLFVVAASLFSACDSGASTSGTGSPSDSGQDFVELEGQFGQIVDEVLVNMTGLDSYGVDASMTTPERDVRESTGWTVEFGSPDSYRFQLVGYSGQHESICFDRPEGGGGEACYDVLTSIESKIVQESVLVGQDAFARTCEDVGVGCDEWQRGERPPLASAGPSSVFLPELPLFLLREISDGVAGRVGEGLQLRGEVNFALVGLMAQECLFDATVQYDQVAITECTEVSAQALEANEEAIREYAENPASVIVWLGEGKFLDRMEISLPEPLAGFEQRIVFEYSYGDFQLPDDLPLGLDS